ncbi:MAG: hypothetical protein CVU51_00155 [Deltaproteobacteria bacterium HGW-Deltaproteobacteria-1]|nr:MAG: hypothetical protein CVU51_00155 [Deltaproteobacteria bacterium HGW-Deltaproteobacteria-1]
MGRAPGLHHAHQRDQPHLGRSSAQLVAGAVLLGMVAPVMMKMAKGWLFQVNDLRSWIGAPGSFVVPLLVAFLSLSLFYKLAPRRPTRFAEVWATALCVTVVLHVADTLFVIYLKNFAMLNAIYGTFGGIMAMLLWIYFSGCIFIFGACLCAAQAEGHFAPEKRLGRTEKWRIETCTNPLIKKRSSTITA